MSSLSAFSLKGSKVMPQWSSSPGCLGSVVGPMDYSPPQQSPVFSAGWVRTPRPPASETLRFHLANSTGDSSCSSISHLDEDM